MRAEERLQRDIASGAVSPKLDDSGVTGRMSALIQCRACGRDISPNAASCPHCGEPRPEAQPKPKQTATGLLAAIIIGLIVGAILFKMIAG